VHFTFESLHALQDFSLPLFFDRALRQYEMWRLWDVSLVKALLHVGQNPRKAGWVIGHVMKNEEIEFYCEKSVIE
jgi:hypothetical protein